MKLTNKFDYPAWVVKCCEAISHKPGEKAISVSLLPQNPMVRHLLLTQWENIVTDVSDFTARLQGIAWHALAEKYAEKGAFAEKTLYAEMDGNTVVGRLDFFDELLKILWDYKTCKAYKIIFDQKEDEDSLWDTLLNLYSWLLSKNGVEVNQIKISAMIKDWSAAEAVKAADYPQCDMITIPIPKWPVEKIEAYIRGRIKVHTSPIVPCTADEMWEKPPVFAIYNPKSMAKAKRLQPTEVDAKNWIEEQGKKGATYIIKERPGCRMNCDRYCSVRSVCEWNVYRNKL